MGEAGGRITFRDYMDLALYYPGLGYYDTGRVALGMGGDFTTSPEVDPAFGALLAQQVIRLDRELGSPAVFGLAEFGAGSGRLMVNLLDTLRAGEPDLYGRLAVRIVETSPALRERQAAVLAEAGHAGVSWADGDDWANSWPGVGLVISNELVDAFPVHRVLMRGGQLRELYVEYDERGKLVSSEGELSTPELASYFEQLGRWPVEGQRTEVNLAALGWLEEVAAKLGRGFVLTIDYGDTADRLYSNLRPDGTLMGYAGGRVTEDPFAAPGEMDLTAHVDFSALMSKGEQVGLRAVWLKRQMEWLVELGIGEMIAGLGGAAAVTPDAYKEAMDKRQRLFRLIDPDHLGRFYVLLQEKV